MRPTYGHEWHCDPFSRNLVSNAARKTRWLCFVLTPSPQTQSLTQTHHYHLVLSLLFNSMGISTHNNIYFPWKFSYCTSRNSQGNYKVLSILIWPGKIKKTGSGVLKPAFQVTRWVLAVLTMGLQWTRSHTHGPGLTLTAILKAFLENLLFRES